MLSMVFLVLAAAEFLLLVWVLRRFAVTRAPALAMAAVPLALQWADAGIIGAGRWIGEGETLLWLNQLRFFWHAFTLPALIIGVGSLLRAAQAPLLTKRWAMAAFCMAAACAWVVQWPWWPQAEFVPACYADTLRYVNRVADTQICRADQPLGAAGGFPVVGLIVILLELLAGLWLWRRRGWIWLTLGSLVVLVTAATAQMRHGMLPSFIGDGLSMLAFAATASVHAADRTLIAQRQPAADHAVGDPDADRKHA